MQYPYLTILEIVTQFLIFFLGTVIIYFLLRIFNKTINFLTVLKAILFYEVFAVTAYVIYPTSIFSSLQDSVLKLLILGIVLFSIFYFIAKKFFQIKWWKSLVVFLLMVVLIFPFLDFSRISLSTRIINLSIFTEENIRLKKQIQESIEEKGPFSIDKDTPLSMRILEKIEGGVFSWTTDALRNIIISR